MAMTNLSGVPASHIFQGSDAPRYHKGFKILFIMAAISMGIMVAMRFVYFYLNRRIKAGKDKIDSRFRYQL